MAKALTKLSVEAAKPDPSGKRRHVPDGGQSGLYLVVQPSGVKSWAVWCRVNGKQKKHTIGRFPAFSLKAAREAAQAVLRNAAEGVDTTAERRRAKREAMDESNLISMLGPAYIAHRAERKGWKPGYREQVERLFNKEVLSRWSKRRVQDITRDDATDLLADIVERISDQDGRGSTANSVYAAILSPFFSWCVDRRKIAATPLPSKEALLSEGALVPGARRDRVLSDQEIKWFWSACDATGGVFGPFYKLALVTGQRRNEIAGMREVELDREAKRWTIPGERTKNRLDHIVPLSDLALSLIDDVPTIDNDQGYIFCTNGQTQISGYSKAKAQLSEAMEKEADGAPIPDWVPHDLRRTLVTHMNEVLSIAPHVVEACVNHVSGDAKRGVAGIYNRALYLNDRISAFDAWSAYLQQLTAGTVDSNVGSLR